MAMRSRSEWRECFRKASNPPGAIFGTILGNYSTAELQDLVLAKDAEIAHLALDFQSFVAVWSDLDPIAKDDFANDLTSLQSSYQKARDLATSTMQARGIGPNTSGDEAYKEVLSAFNPLWASNGIAPGSLDELRSRLAIAMKSAGRAPTPYQVPQPAKGSDADLSAMNAAAPVAKAVDKTIAVASSAGSFLAGTLLRDVAIVGGVALGVLLVARKAGL